MKIARLDSDGEMMKFSESEVGSLAEASPLRKMILHPFVNSDRKRALATVRQMVAIANSNTGEFRLSVHFNIESS